MEGPQFDEDVASATPVSLAFGFRAWNRFVEVKREPICHGSTIRGTQEVDPRGVNGEGYQQVVDESGQEA